MTLRRLLTTPEVCRLLNVTPDWFYRNRLRLQREQGFPTPLPGLGRDMRWDPRALEDWLDRVSGRTQGPTTVEVQSEPDWEAELENRIQLVASSDH
ncbi:helix-turn-helix transcriptional regulator [Fodinicurvata sediminis]|uniref:helix-turn-helix transcriptional regulator n=1 Tax=Fodinicurvata sediminis TaxID=1121832 RepID=UPI0003B5CE0A|nr:helix-turn-helix domain-containing protein [Fodinicurvata sediminis]